MKKLFTAVFLSLLAVCSVSAGPVITGNAEKGWTIKTGNAAYRLTVAKDGPVKLSYFGPASVNPEVHSSAVIDEVPVRGGYVDEKPILEAVFPDKVRDIELEFVKGEITEVDGRPALVLEQKDKYYPLTVKSYIRVIPEMDIMEKWLEVDNGGRKSIMLDNMQSGSVFLPKDEYELTTFQGVWGNEFMPETTNLTTGTKTIEVRDFKSYGSSYFSVRPAGDNSATEGPVWFGMVNYSGNWKVDFYKRFANVLQVTAGVNYWDTSWELKGGTSRSTPKMVVGYTPKGPEEASRNMRKYVDRCLLPAGKRDKVRPVLYNSWYATTFDVNEEHQLALAGIAKEIGVEMFVIDDGWFKGRVNDRGGLGDWTVDYNKFPDGLNPMIEKINAMGLDFGLWIEPEMINPNSDLYRKHPDWVLHFDNRQRSEVRNQLVLNLAREDVYQYLLKSFTELLETHNIKFVKWDHNRPISQPGWPGETLEKQREVRIRYVDNLYRLFGELTSRFPDVWFEGCSGGGGRADGGILSFVDMTWASDNTDPVGRQFIQHGYLSAFPAKTMVSWVTYEDHNAVGFSLGYKFDVCMQGVLGIGNNITEWNDEQKKVASEKIALYKEIRDAVQMGDVYRLVSPFEGNRTAVQYMSEDGKNGVLMLYNRERNIGMAKPEDSRSAMLKLQGLQPDAVYSIEGQKAEFTGRQLMDTGIGWPVWGAYRSRILKVARVN